MSFKATRDSRIKKIGDVYYAWFSRRGVRVRKSLDTSNFEHAKMQVEAMERKLLLGKTAESAVFFEDTWPAFITDLKLENRPVTIAEYERMYKNYYLEFFGGNLLSEMADRWPEFVEFFRGKTDKKLFNAHKYLNRFFTWCEEKQLLAKKPHIHNPDKKSENIGIALTNEQIDAILKNSSAKLHLAIHMALFMGMRRSEFTQLKREAIDLKTRTITLRSTDTKISKGRSFPIHPRVLPLLEAQLSSHRRRYLFPNKWRPMVAMDKTGFKTRWKKTLEDSGFHCRMHDLRHTFITRAFAAPGVNLMKVCVYAGVSIDTARRVYLHWKANDLRDVVELDLGVSAA